MDVVPLYASPILAVREVICDAPRGSDCGDEYSSTPCVAIPLRGCYVVDRRRRAIVADPNTAIFFDAVVPYRVAHPADAGDVSFVIDCDSAAIADAFGNGTHPDAEMRPFRATYAHVMPDVQLRVRLLRRALTSGDVDPLAVEERAFAIVAALAGTRVPELNSARWSIVERAKAFLGGHFREPVSLGDAARAAGASPFSLARAFPHAAGTTMHRYLVALRLAAALDAIAAGAADLSRVAVDAGFAHHSHLSKTFARVFGATPRSVRARLKLPPETKQRRLK